MIVFFFKDNNIFIEISKTDRTPDLYNKISQVYKLSTFDKSKNELIYVKPFTDRLNRGKNMTFCCNSYQIVFAKEMFIDRHQKC